MEIIPGENIKLVFKNRPRVKERFILNPKKAALLVIDMQKNHFSAAWRKVIVSLQVKRWSQIILELSTGCSEAGVSCNIDPAYVTEATILDVRASSMMITSGKVMGSEIIDELKIIKVCDVIKKNTYDAFWNTKLQETLLSLNVEQL